MVYLFLFHFYLTLYSKWVSCKQHIFIPYFLIQFDHLYLLLILGMFRPFTFNVITDVVGFKCTILLFIFYLSHLFSVSSLVFFFFFQLSSFFFLFNFISTIGSLVIPHFKKHLVVTVG